MRYAVFSDIHSNLEGLQAVLEECERSGAEALLCCGDIIGYNADPEACVDLVRAKRVRCIRGNHERGLQDLEEGRTPNMNPVAMEALHYTRDALSRERLDWLLSLPDELQVEGIFYLFHGAPSDPDEYIFDRFEAAYAFKSLLYEYTAPANLLCFIGHTHVCAAYAFDPDNKRIEEFPVQDGSRFDIAPGFHYIFNVGSCGQYRGGIPAATMGVLDTEAMSFEYRFLSYDMPTCQRKIVEHGLPLFLAQRLGIGQ